MRKVDPVLVKMGIAVILVSAVIYLIVLPLIFTPYARMPPFLYAFFSLENVTLIDENTLEVKLKLDGWGGASARNPSLPENFGRLLIERENGEKSEFFFPPKKTGLGDILVRASKPGWHLIKGENVRIRVITNTETSNCWVVLS
jgi:hypothetical protein